MDEDIERHEAEVDFDSKMRPEVDRLLERAVRVRALVLGRTHPWTAEALAALEALRCVAGARAPLMATPQGLGQSFKLRDGRAAMGGRVAVAAMG